MKRDDEPRPSTGTVKLLAIENMLRENWLDLMEAAGLNNLLSILVEWFSLVDGKGLQ